MIRVGIIGATGYAGGELVRLLMGHKEAEIVWYGSKSYLDRPYSSVFRNMLHLADDPCSGDDLMEMAEKTDVIFTATPQGFLASKIGKELLDQVKIIDLSADFRLKDVSVYEHWYKLSHQAPDLIEEAVYGLCEWNREKIKKARLIANPGCYPTCSFLSIYPLLKAGIVEEKGIIIDAKSGTSGAGRGAKTENLYCEVNENIKAYGVAVHRHTPEIEQQLSEAAGKEVMINFTPHLVPMNRGILITAYGTMKKKQDGTYYSTEELKEIYKECYKNEYFIRILPGNDTPETKWVEGSNFVDINVIADERTGRVIFMGAMDNLVKGAAGQAVQNMNLMFGLKEETGLQYAPMFP